MNSRTDFENFIAKINLEAYRIKYAPIKIVEMDLDKNIQALELMYKVYWEDRKFLNFGDFYKLYLNNKKELLEQFRTKIQMCENCFYKGLPARIYRTWASIITQIQGGYVAESVFGIGTISMSEELDRKGADIRIKYKDKIINCQVKKESQSREVRKAKSLTSKLEGSWININYFVPQRKDLESPNKKNGDLKGLYKKFISDKRLKYLPNGFVIFTNELFLPIKKEMDETTL